MTTLQQALIRATYEAAHRAVRITQSPHSAHSGRFHPFPMEPRLAAERVWARSVAPLELSELPLGQRRAVWLQRLQPWFRPVL